MKEFFKKRFVLSFIIALGFALRAAFFMINIHNFRLYGDAQSYFLMVHQLIEKGIYGYATLAESHVSNAFVTPGYPLFLAALFSLVHDRHLQITAVRMLQVILSAATPFLGYLFVRCLLKKENVALLTALFIAVYPPYIESTVFLFTEVIALFTMLLYFYLTLAAFEKKKAYLTILSGMSFAVHTLIRPAMLPLFILPYVYAFFVRDKKERGTLVKTFLQALSGFILLMAPWWIRNYLVFHQVILTATQTGNPLLGGTYPYMKNLYGDLHGEMVYNTDLQFKHALQRIWTGFTTQPFYYLKWYTLGKYGTMFGIPWLYKDHLLFQDPWLYRHLPHINGFNIVLHRFLVGIGTMGVLLNSLKDRRSRLMNVYWLVFLAIYLVFIPINRYAYQLMFFLILASATLICNVFAYGIGYKNRKTGKD